MFIRLIIAIGLTIISTVSALSQTYYDDLTDIADFNKPPSPIGNIGELQRIIDLRGFVPLSLFSKKKTTGLNGFINWDCNLWFKIPTRVGIQCIYYGADDIVNTTTNTPIVTENSQIGDDHMWVLFAYEIASKQGDSLYKVFGTGKGFEGGEPIAVLFTNLTTIIVVNLRYSDWESNGTGQYLVALEFSRSLHLYKTCYLLHSTESFSKSTKEIFSKSAPLINKALGLIFYSN